MPKKILTLCPLCRGKHLIALPDGRGRMCPCCDGVGFKLKEAKPAIEEQSRSALDKLMGDVIKKLDLL